MGREDAQHEGGRGGGGGGGRGRGGRGGGGDRRRDHSDHQNGYDDRRWRDDYDHRPRSRQYRGDGDGEREGKGGSGRGRSGGQRQAREYDYWRDWRSGGKGGRDRGGWREGDWGGDYRDGEDWNRHDERRRPRQEDERWRARRDWDRDWPEHQNGGERPASSSRSPREPAREKKSLADVCTVPDFVTEEVEDEIVEILDEGYWWPHDALTGRATQHFGAVWDNALGRAKDCDAPVPNFLKHEIINPLMQVPAEEGFPLGVTPDHVLAFEQDWQKQTPEEAQVGSAEPLLPAKVGSAIHPHVAIVCLQQPCTLSFHAPDGATHTLPLRRRCALIMRESAVRMRHTLHRYSRPQEEVDLATPDCTERTVLLVFRLLLDEARPRPVGVWDGRRIDSWSEEKLARHDAMRHEMKRRCKFRQEMKRKRDEAEAQKHLEIELEQLRRREREEERREAERRKQEEEDRRAEADRLLREEAAAAAAAAAVRETATSPLKLAGGLQMLRTDEELPQPPQNESPQPPADTAPLLSRDLMGALQADSKPPQQPNGAPDPFAAPSYPPVDPGAQLPQYGAGGGLSWGQPMELVYVGANKEEKPLPGGRQNWGQRPSPMAPDQAGALNVFAKPFTPGSLMEQASGQGPAPGQAPVQPAMGGFGFSQQPVLQQQRPLQQQPQQPPPQQPQSVGQMPQFHQTMKFPVPSGMQQPVTQIPGMALQGGGQQRPGMPPPQQQPQQQQPQQPQQQQQQPQQQQNMQLMGRPSYAFTSGVANVHNVRYLQQYALPGQRGGMPQQAPQQGRPQQPQPQPQPQPRQDPQQQFGALAPGPIGGRGGGGVRPQPRPSGAPLGMAQQFAVTPPGLQMYYTQQPQAQQQHQRPPSQMPHQPLPGQPGTLQHAAGATQPLPQQTMPPMQMPQGGAPPATGS